MKACWRGFARLWRRGLIDKVKVNETTRRYVQKSPQACMLMNIRRSNARTLGALAERFFQDTGLAAVPRMTRNATSRVHAVFDAYGYCTEVAWWADS